MAKAKTEIKLNSYITEEIAKFSQSVNVDSKVLEAFAFFVIDTHKKKPPVKVKPLTQAQLKKAVFDYFSVTTTDQLKKSGSFKMATNGMGKISFVGNEAWEKLYRSFIGVLPHEEGETGYGCINGINIFNYSFAWRAFELDPKKSTTEDVKKAYRDLAKIYHPDSGSTGDAAIFDRLNIFYKSLVAEA